MRVPAITTVTLLAALVATSGCLSTRSERVKETRRGLDAEIVRDRPALDEQRIEDFGFAVYWDSYIRDEVITGLFLEGRVYENGAGKPFLYATTLSNRLYQIDMNHGTVKWVYDIGRPMFFTENPRPIAEWVYPADKNTGFKQYDEIYFVARDYLYALDKASGSELWKVRLPFAASSPPEAGPTHVYVGSWDDRLYAYRKDEPLIPDWSWRTDGDILARPACRPPIVYAASTDGFLYPFDMVRGVPKAPFDTEQRLETDPLIHRSLLYLGAGDFNMYCLSAIDGALEHRQSAQAPVIVAPVASANSEKADDYTVYFTARGEGVMALRRQDQKEGQRRVPHALVWQRKGAERFLARGRSDAYLLEPDPENQNTRIARVDAKDGHFRDAIEIPGVDYYVTNPSSPNVLEREEQLVGGMIVLGFENGWIIALKELATMPSGTYETVAQRRAAARAAGLRDEGANEK